MNKAKFSRCGLILLAADVVMMFHVPAAAQTCHYNFSYYDDVYFSSDGSTIYSSVSVVDNSGCNHSQYTTCQDYVTEWPERFGLTIRPERYRGHFAGRRNG